MLIEAAQEPRLSFGAYASLVLVNLYQRWLSPLVGGCCRFSPTCSEYTRQAIVRHGFFRGWQLGIWRIIRCNPFSEGGDDPAPE